MNHLNPFGNSLGKIGLTIGHTKKVISLCTGPFTKTLNINCSSWNASKSHIKTFVMNNKGWKRIELIF